MQTRSDISSMTTSQQACCKWRIGILYMRLSPLHVFIKSFVFEFSDVISRLSLLLSFSAVLFSLSRCYCRETSPDGQYLHVMYIDYGNTEWLQREKTVKLNSPFFELRPQGVLLKLAGKEIILNFG